MKEAAEEAEASSMAATGSRRFFVLTNNQLCFGPRRTEYFDATELTQYNDEKEGAKKEERRRTMENGGRAASKTSKTTVSSAEIEKRTLIAENGFFFCLAFKRPDFLHYRGRSY